MLAKAVARDIIIVRTFRLSVPDDIIIHYAWKQKT
jgi:hypothetical protein